VGEVGYYVDDASNLRRVRAVAVHLLPEHVTRDIRGSDIYCCTGSPSNCFGWRMFIDVFTGEMFTAPPRCHYC